MRTYFAVGIALAGLVAFVPMRVRADATSSPGKFAAAATLTDVDLSSDPVSVFTTLALAKGKAKRLLVLNVTASSDSYDGRVTIVSHSVNGVDFEPQPSAAHPNCIDANSCAVSSTMWIDLDAAEAANPGVFIGQPLSIDCHAGTLRFGGAGGTLTLSCVAQLVKK